MADMDRILEAEMRRHRGEIVGIMVEIVPVARLRRASMSTPVMRDYAIALAQKEKHLRVPIVRG
jgi:hypothetical protein